MTSQAGPRPLHQRSSPLYQRALRPALLGLAVTLTAACSQVPQQAQNPAVPAQETVAIEPQAEVTPAALPVESPVPFEPITLMCLPEEAPAWIAPVHGDIWERMRAGFALDLSNDNPRVIAELKWFGRHQDYIDRVVGRASLYLYYVVDELERNDIPLEIALLPIVESAYDPFAYSHGRASGMWQFIPSTGKSYGLKQNWWYDGRRDVRASTAAAIAYLSALSRRYDGDWELALAAYNAGQGNVDRAIRRNKKAGKPTDFWSLKLPRETSAYVPRLLAVSRIVAEPAKYNVRLNPVPNEPYFHPVDIGGQIDLAEAARISEVSVEDIYRLNPGFNRWATDPRGPFELLMPVTHADAFAARIDELDLSDRLKWEHYKVVSGDNLGSIALRHKTSVSAIKQANQLSSNTIRVGQKLMIPIPSQGAEHYSLSHEQRIAAIQSRAGGNSRDKVTYEVRRGDSFWKIARKFDVSTNQVAKWNGMSPKDPIRPGQKLVVWTDSASASQMRSSSSPLPTQSIRKVGYTVKRGDSLARIASKFNVKLNDILKWNPIERSEYLQPGQKLNLYIDVTNVN